MEIEQNSQQHSQQQQSSHQQSRQQQPTSLAVRLPSYDPLNDLMHDINSETAQRVIEPLAALVADFLARAEGKLTQREIEESVAAYDMSILEMQAVCTGCDGEGCPACNGKGWDWAER